MDNKYREAKVAAMTKKVHFMPDAKMEEPPSGSTNADIPKPPCANGIMDRSSAWNSIMELHSARERALRSMQNRYTRIPALYLTAPLARVPTPA